MRKLTIILFITFSINCYSQVKNNEVEKIEIIDPQIKDSTIKVKINNEIVYDLVDEPAEFPGGMYACKNFILTNLVYPSKAKEKGIEGKCYLKFIITESGEVSNVKVIKGVQDCPECDQEAIRLIKSMPKWEPGKINGKPVNSTFTLPVQFKLD